MKKLFKKVRHLYCRTKKMLLIMRLSVLFILIAILSSSASVYSQATKLTLKMENVRISDVFDAIEDQSEFIFFYNRDYFDDTRFVSVDYKNVNIEVVLKDLFKEKTIYYEVIDHNILIKIPNTITKMSLIDQQPQISLSGRVTDIYGQPLPGVTVLIKGTTQGTTTNIDGEYLLVDLHQGDIIVFSFIGMETKEIKVGNQTIIDVTLEELLTEIEDVVVVGYGVQRKESVVGSLSQATGENIRQNVQGADLGTALTGAVPGLISLRSTGIPGGTDLVREQYAAYSELYIRGKKTWNEAAPLVLVDGVERDMRNVNPYEIEKISILKDASATAIFGVKGANGVILITTSRGKEGKANLTFDFASTAKMPSRIAEKPSAYESNRALDYAMMNDLAINPDSWGKIRPERWLELTRDQTYPEYLPDTNWKELMLRDYTVDYNFNMTVSGGTKLVKYFGSASYLHESDILNISDIGQGYDPSNAFHRYNFRSNLDFDITPTTRFSTNLAGSYSIQRRATSGNYAYMGIWGQAPDLWPTKYSDGTYAYYEVTHNAVNVFMEYHYNGYQRATSTDITTDYILDQKLDFITKGLSGNLKISYDYRDRSTGGNVGSAHPITKYIFRNIVDEITPGMNEKEIKALEEKYTEWNANPQYYLAEHGYDWSMPENSFGTESADADRSYRNLFYQLSFNYGRDFGKHSVTGLGLVSRQETSSGSVFPRFREDWVGRLTYEYDRKYLFEANGAYNGSEKFDRKYRFGFFPSLAFGWIASNEPFFEYFKPFFSNFKIRYSDGKVGSDAGIDRWLYTESWIAFPIGSGGTDVWRFGSPYMTESFPFRYEGVIANPNIHWETSRKKDFGIETGFLDNKLTINFDYFIENRSDIFVSAGERVIPAYFGASPVAVNLGKVDVKGFEIESEFKQVTSSGFIYWVSYAFSSVKDKILKKGDPELAPFYQKQEGYMIDQPRGYLSQNSVKATWNDVYATVGNNENTNWTLPGDWGIVDFNSDGVISKEDQAPMSYPARPQYSYAPSLGASYKNLSLSMRFYGTYNVAGNVRDYITWWDDMSYEANIPQFLIDESWCPERGNAETAIRPQMRGMTHAVTQPTYIETRAFLRLENAEIAYSLNHSNSPWVNELGVNNIRFSLSGNNLFLISKMRSDMDYQGAQSDNRQMYPILRRFKFGINIDF